MLPQACERRAGCEGHRSGKENPETGRLLAGRSQLRHHPSHETMARDKARLPPEFPIARRKGHTFPSKSASHGVHYCPVCDFCPVGRLGGTGGGKKRSTGRILFLSFFLLFFFSFFSSRMATMAQNSHLNEKTVIFMKTQRLKPAAWVSGVRSWVLILPCPSTQVSSFLWALILPAAPHPSVNSRNHAGSSPLSQHSCAVITPSLSLENAGRTLDTKKSLTKIDGGVRPGTELGNRIAPLNCLEVDDGSPRLPLINASGRGSAVRNLSESWVAPAPSIHPAVNISRCFRSQESLGRSGITCLPSLSFSHPPRSWPPLFLVEFLFCLFHEVLG